jgi:hypothetical protein
MAKNSEKAAAASEERKQRPIQTKVDADDRARRGSKSKSAMQAGA